jgi:hypothetical protein
MSYNLYQIINLNSDSRLPKKLTIRPRLLLSADSFHETAHILGSINAKAQVFNLIDDSIEKTS